MRSNAPRVDDGAHRDAEVLDGIADRERRDLREQPRLQRRPEAPGDVRARRGRALLALVLEGAAAEGGGERVHVGRRMGEDEVLPARLADDPRVAAVARQVLGDRPPHALEHRRRAGEVEAAELGARERRVPHAPPRARHEVDHAGREPGGLEQLQEPPPRVDGGGGGLPQHGVAHQRRRGGQVRGDRGEVERRHREHEPLQRPVLDAIPDPGRRERLLLEDPLGERAVEAPEVDHLAGGVELRLVDRLRLTEHGRGVQRRTPAGGEELRRPQEDRRALVERQARPPSPRGARRLDRRLDLGGAGLVRAGEPVRVTVWRADVDEAAGANLAAPEDQRHLELLGRELLQARLQLSALGRARPVRQGGLVARRRNAEETVRHDTPPSSGSTGVAADRARVRPPHLREPTFAAGEAGASGGARFGGLRPERAGAAAEGDLRGRRRGPRAARRCRCSPSAPRGGR